MLHPDIRNRKPVGRRPLRFIDEENMLAVGDQLATKVSPYPARAAFDVYSLLQPGPLLGSWNDRSCECLSHLESPSFWGRRTRLAMMQERAISPLFPSSLRAGSQGIDLRSTSRGQVPGGRLGRGQRSVCVGWQSPARWPS